MIKYEDLPCQKEKIKGKCHIRYKTKDNKYRNKTIYNVSTVMQAIKITNIDGFIYSVRMYKDSLQNRRIGHDGTLKPREKEVWTGY